MNKIRLALGYTWMGLGVFAIIPYGFVRIGSGPGATDGFGLPVTELPGFLKLYLFGSGATDWHGWMGIVHFAVWAAFMGVGSLILPKAQREDLVGPR
jgi:hypothetical protein